LTSPNPNDKYANAARLSAQFTLNQMLNAEEFVHEFMYIDKPGGCTYNDEIWAFDSGVMIESFSILADVLQDEKWRNA
jgi:hypothetical protein